MKKNLKERDKSKYPSCLFKVGISHLIYSTSFILIWKLEAAESRIVKDSVEHESWQGPDDCSACKHEKHVFVYAAHLMHCNNLPHVYASGCI